MFSLKVFKNAISLFSPSEQKQYAMRILTGIAISILDIFGIILVGFISFDPSTNLFEKIPGINSLTNLDKNILVFVVTLFFLLKSLGSVFMIRNTNRFLTSIAVKNSFFLATNLFSRNISNSQNRSWTPPVFERPRPRIYRGLPTRHRRKG